MNRKAAAKNVKGLEAGARVRTNDHYARAISAVPRTGTLEKFIVSNVEGLCRVRVDDIEDAWLIHANFLERAE